jgi:hypothetical protein
VKEPVVIEEYNPRWPGMYKEAEAKTDFVLGMLGKARDAETRAGN